MKTVFDFIELRPVFTLYGLKIIWFAFLLNLAIQYFTLAVGLYNASGPGNIWVWPGFIPHLLSTLVNIGLVRVLLEVAAAILLRRDPIKTVQNSN